VGRVGVRPRMPVKLAIAGKKLLPLEGTSLDSINARSPTAEHERKLLSHMVLQQQLDGPTKNDPATCQPKKSRQRIKEHLDMLSVSLQYAW